MMTDCKFKENLGALVDGELSPTNKEKLLAHIAECPECEKEYLELMATKNAFKSLETDPKGELADSVMERIRHLSPQRKTPFLLRHAGLAASLVLIAFLFLYARFIPDKKADTPKDTGKMTLMNDKSTAESYFGELKSDSDDIVFVQEPSDLPTADSTREDFAIETAPEDIIPESETPKGTPPISADEVTGNSAPSYDFSGISYSNSLSPTTSILVVNATLSEVTPHIAAYNTVVNSENCITVDISAPDLEKILLKNSVDVVSSLLYKESTSTAIYFE